MLTRRYNGYINPQVSGALHRAVFSHSCQSYVGAPHWESFLVACPASLSAKVSRGCVSVLASQRGMSKHTGWGVACGRFGFSFVLPAVLVRAVATAATVISSAFTLLF